MKRTIVLLATLLLSFGLVSANEVALDVQVNGTSTTDTIWSLQPVKVFVNATATEALGGASLGVEISTTDAATWTWDAVKVDTMGWAGMFSLTGCLVTEYDADGVLPDLLLAGGATITPIPAGTYWHAYQGMAGPDDDPSVGYTLCFDSMFVPPAGNFVFVSTLGSAFTPGWAHGDQPLCFVVAKAPNFCPEFVITEAATDVDHCGSATINFGATDVEDDAISYDLVGHTGTGTAVVNPGAVSYTPGAGEVGAVTVTVGIGDAFNGPSCGTFDFTFTSTNNAPTIACGLDRKVGKGGLLEKTDIVSGDVDGCDVLTYGVVSLTGPVAYTNAPTFDGTTFSWQTEDAEVGFWTATVFVDDGFGPVACSFMIEVLATEPYGITIDCAIDVLQGHFVDIDILMNGGSEAMGGFDFLIAYDPTALTFTEANMGASLAACGWEYFTYRYGAHGNCGNGCPSGEIRIVGMAETNNGPYHPDFDCIETAQADGVLATLTFYVTTDYNFGGHCIPVGFLWFDCGDNTISVMSGDTLAIADLVFPASADPEDPTQAFPIPGGFPTMMGAPDVCLDGDKVAPVRFINFQNGCVCIIHPDDIDGRGDLNVNGVLNEIADAVMFTNYFISGLSAFGTHVEASIAASDVNSDGVALSVADLVYLVRVIIGDANPYPKPAPGEVANFSMQGDVVTYTSNIELGAALFIFNGNAAPQLNVNGMEMKYGVDNGQTRVLVYSMDGNTIPGGSEVLTVSGSELIGVEAGTSGGYVIDASFNNLPTQFELKQNYPNPFNPATTIAMNLPVASDWTVSIYNVAGQLVNTYSGFGEAGQVNVVWDGTDASNAKVASGIYFYKATASSYSATKKMVLMK